MTSIFQRWIEALLPDPVTVAGVDLHPLSFGHALLLGRLTGWEPLVVPFPPENIPLGLFVCSRPWPEAFRGMGQAQRFVRRLAAKATMGDAVRAWTDYLSRSLVLPSIRENRMPDRMPVTSRRSEAPLLLRLRLFAFAELGTTETELGDLVLADLVWMWIAHGEETGAIRMLGDGDAEFEAWAKSQDLLRKETA